MIYLRDKGFKIVKPGKNTNSLDPADYIYWSKFPAVPLIETVPIEINFNGAESGTFTYTHGLGFAPHVVAVNADTLIFQTSVQVVPFSMENIWHPAVTKMAYDPFADEEFEATGDNRFYSIKSKENTIEIEWYCSAFVPMTYGGYYIDDVFGNLILQIYMVKLGELLQIA